MLRKVFSHFFQKILDLSKAIGGFESPLPCNGNFECSVHIFRDPCLGSDDVKRLPNFNETKVAIGINKFSKTNNKVKVMRLPILGFRLGHENFQDILRCYFAIKPKSQYLSYFSYKKLIFSDMTSLQEQVKKPFCYQKLF